MSAHPEHRRAAIAAISIVLALTACSRSSTPNEPAYGTPSPSASPVVDRWLAAVGVAPLADDLDTLTERLLEPLGEALVVSPVDCFEGLPADVDDGYVIGALAESRGRAEALVAEAGERPLFTASVTMLCTD